MKPLRLKAETSEDLKIISSALQDAIGRVGEIHFDRKGRALTLRLTRFRHETKSNERIQTGLRIDGITDLKTRGLDRSNPEAMAVLLTLSFTPSDTPPGGDLHLVFAGGGEILAQVEALDAILADVSEPRKTDKIPLHPLD